MAATWPTVRTAPLVSSESSAPEKTLSSRASVAALYRIAPERISDFVEYDPAYAIKFTIYRLTPSGSAGDGDIFGAQQYAPLLDLAVPA